MAPYWYWRSLKTDWVVDEAATNRLDLPDQGALSGLILHIETLTEQPLYNYVDAWPVQRTNIQIQANGNFDVMNLAGKQLHAMNWWDSGLHPHECLSGVDNELIEQYLYIPFGRYLGDPDYGLWLDKFAAGVQFVDTNTIDTAYYVNGDTKYTILGLFRKNPEGNLFSKGFLRKRQIKDKLAASETQYDLTIPSTNKLRNIMLFSVPACTAGAMTTVWWNEMKYLWLSIKSGEEFIIENQRTDNFARYMHDMMHRKAETDVRAQAYSGGPYMDTMIDEVYIRQYLAMWPNTPFYITADTGSTWTRYARYYGWDSSGTTTSTPLVGIRTEGIMMHGMLPLLPTDPMSDENSWLDAGANADVDVQITEAVSTGHWYAVLDELQKTYPT